MNRLVTLVVAGLVTLSNVGCNLKPASTANLYLDNSGNATVRVSVDGQLKATIRPHRFECVSVDLGSRHIEYESNNEVIYSTTQTFEPNDIPLIPGSYLVNPDESVCYCSTTATYGYDAQAEQLEQLITHVSSGGDEVPRKELIPRFQRLLSEMKVFEATEPTRFEVQRYTLKPLPNSVKAMKHAVSRDRSALIRIPRELHDLIVELNHVKIPSENDMKTAAKLRLTVDSLLPFED